MGKRGDLPSVCSASEPSGVLVVDKPEGITSHQAVAQVKSRLSLRKAGHCGTLDPFATGVLLVCINQATRISDQLQIQDKAYRFVMHLGVETDTLDHTGRVVRTHAGEPCSPETLFRALERFRGVITQKVPLFAAVRVNGDRLYKLARKGLPVEVPPREVTVHELELLEWLWPKATLEVRCSKGTYVRQLAADIGTAAGCGAHLCQLRRLASGPFHVDQAVPLQEIASYGDGESPFRRMLTMNEALGSLPEVRIEDSSLLRAAYEGYLDPEWEAEQRRRLSVTEGPVRLVDERSCLVAMWWPWAEGKERRKLRVFK